jgi:hypothetical protein
MRRVLSGRSIASLFLSLGLAAPLSAQTATGSITGRVTDASGSIIAGATVNLTSSERGVVTSTNSNDAGVYVFPNVQPGDYRMDVQREGFKKTEVTKLTVNVGDHIEENFRLEIGSVREAVTVEGGATLVVEVVRHPVFRPVSLRSPADETMPSPTFWMGAITHPSLTEYRWSIPTPIRSASFASSKTTTPPNMAAATAAW